MTKFAWMCSTEAYQAETLLEQAKLAEQAGFDAIVVPDAFHPWTDEGASTLTWSWLGAAAAATERIELITTVTAPLLRYHPAIIAQGAATIDRLSKGRFILGLGTGHPLHDSSLGFPDVGFRERTGRLEEATQIIRGLLSGEEVTLEGEHYTVEGARLYGPPTHGVRIFMAAAGPRSAALAGRLADGVITSVKDVDTARIKVVEPFLAAANEEGSAGGSTLLATRWVVLGRDDAKAWESLGALRGLRIPGRDVLTDPADIRREADRIGKTQILSGFARAKDLSEVAELYEPLVRDLAADYVSIQLATTDPDEAIRVIGADVLPALRG